MIYNNSPPGNVQEKPRKTPHLLHTGGRKHQQFGFQEPENESPTITQKRFPYVCNYLRTLSSRIPFGAHTRYDHLCKVWQTVSVR